MAVDASELDRLFEVIASRKGADASTSYSAKLMAGGPALCARKFGEEAIETVIAALGSDRNAVISESADLLYHWLVTLAATGVNPAEVYSELARREGRSGLDEKASRGSSAGKPETGV
ncbi:MAG: phosphoribosyl-ATP diphosphatase [Parvibaculaceae bacterium]